MTTCQLLCGDSIEELRKLEEKSVQCAVTSPPYYGLRDYGTAEWKGGDSECQHIDEYAKAEQERNRKGLARNANESDGGSRLSIVQNGIDKEFQYKDACKKCGATRTDSQIGLEPSPEAYVEKLVAVFREVRRVLKDDGVLWLNLGDSYWGGKGASSQAWSTEHQERDTLQKAQHQITGKGETRPTDGKHLVIKPKDLIGIPWMVAFALRADGWYLRQDIIWAKPNPMPESVTDRCTKAHEYIFLLSKSKKYFYDFEAILEPANYDGRKETMMKGSAKYKNGFAPTDDNPNTLHTKGHERWSRKLVGTNNGGDGTGFRGHSGNHDADGNPLGHEKDGAPARNKRSVWTVTTKPYKEAHFATFPPDLIEPCILAGSKIGDIVIDPFNGSGTTGQVALTHGRSYIGIDLNPEYIELSRKRIGKVQPRLVEA